jgi:alkylhydroperoxidase family enzyme
MSAQVLYPDKRKNPIGVRVRYLNQVDLPKADRDLYDGLYTKPASGCVFNIYRVLAHAPNLFRVFVGLLNGLRGRTRLESKLQQLAMITVSRLLDFEYDLALRRDIAVNLGVAPRQIKHLAEFETSPLFDEQERAVMRYASEATIKINVCDETFDALRAFLDNRGITELVLCVAVQNAAARIAVPLRVDVESEKIIPWVCKGIKI